MKRIEYFQNVFDSYLSDLDKYKESIIRTDDDIKYNNRKYYESDAIKKLYTEQNRIKKELYGFKNILDSNIIKDAIDEVNKEAKMEKQELILEKIEEYIDYFSDEVERLEKLTSTKDDNKKIKYIQDLKRTIEFRDFYGLLLLLSESQKYITYKQRTKEKEYGKKVKKVKIKVKESDTESD